MPRKYWKVIYRTGGTLNFQWREVFTRFYDRAEASAKAEEIRRMGYKALIHDGATLASVGMPDTYEPL